MARDTFQNGEKYVGMFCTGWASASPLEIVALFILELDRDQQNAEPCPIAFRAGKQEG